MNILMTGCSRSMGLYVADKLRKQGHRIFGVGIGGPDYEIDFSKVGMLEFEMPDIFDKAEAAMGGAVQILLNNAAITQIDFMEDHDSNDFIKVVNVDLIAPFLFTQELVRRVADQYPAVDISSPENYYRVISTTSMGNRTSLRASPGYCAAKCGLEALTRMWAREFSTRHPIITAAIAPAGIDETAMKQQCIDDLQRTRGMTEEEATKYFTQAPLGRNCTFDEVWKLFDFCVNSMPVYCSGETFNMMGGTGL